MFWQSLHYSRAIMTLTKALINAVVFKILGLHWPLYQLENTITIRVYSSFGCLRGSLFCMTQLVIIFSSRSCFKLGLPIGGYLLALAPGREHGGGDAVRAYTSITDESDATVEPTTDSSGSFEIICKRYDQWGMKESIETHFLFTKTDHSYRPPGAVSNYLHSLQPGSSMQFKCNFFDISIGGIYSNFCCS